MPEWRDPVRVGSARHGEYSACMKLAGGILLVTAAIESALLILSLALAVLYATYRPTIVGVVVLLLVGGLAVAGTVGLGLVMRRAVNRRPRWLGLESWWLGVFAALVLFWIAVQVDSLLMFGTPIPAAP